jgi:hypothetical protein
MLAVILAFMGGWRNLIAAGLLASSVTALLYYVHEYDKRGREITALEYKLSAKQSEVVVLETNIDLLNSTIGGLNNRLAERSGNLEQFCKILGEINASKDPKDDEAVGGTAVPLVFDRLKQMEKKQ